MQYKVITEGTGAIPADSCKVKVNYKGTLIDGTEFDSSYKRNAPATFRANQVIKGWTEALTMMPVGSKWELYIPQELAYGARESGQIKPFSTLIFEVELVGNRTGQEIRKYLGLNRRKERRCNVACTLFFLLFPLFFPVKEEELK